jgi:zeaxanthin glucosyltransferase
MTTEQRARHFGVMSFTGTGHLNSLIALGRELKDRGHRVTFFEKPKIESRVIQAGLDFFPITARASSFQKHQTPPGDPHPGNQLSTLQFNLKRIKADLDTYLQQTPPALTLQAVDALIVNEIALTGPTVAQIAGLPYFIISTSVPHHFGWNDLPRLAGYKYSTSIFSWLETALFEVSALRMRGPIRRAINHHRRQRGLGPVQTMRESFPELAHITQLPQCLDFPRSGLPENFHYTGPFTNYATRPQVDFPWHKLDGRPLLYASLGTTRNVQAFVFRLVAEACRHLDLQLVISLGGRFDPDTLPDLPGNPLVTKYAPQLELLKRATAVITHGGPNTVFETLMQGKPMVAIPLAHDQPAVAARLARLGIAEVLPVMRLSADKIQRAVSRIITVPTYREAAVKMQAQLHSLHGLKRAADVIETALDKYANVPPHGLAAGHGRQADGAAMESLTVR